MAEQGNVTVNLVWDGTATAQFYMNDSLIETVIKQYVAVRGRDRLLELIGAADGGSELGSVTGSEMERLDIISISSGTEDSRSEGTDNEGTEGQFDDAEESSDEERVDEARTTQELEESDGNSENGEGGTDAVWPFRSCAWHPPQRLRGTKRKRDEDGD